MAPCKESAVVSTSTLRFLTALYRSSPVRSLFRDEGKRRPPFCADVSPFWAGKNHTQHCV